MRGEGGGERLAAQGRRRTTGAAAACVDGRVTISLPVSVKLQVFFIEWKTWNFIAKGKRFDVCDKVESPVVWKLQS